MHPLRQVHARLPGRRHRLRLVVPRARGEDAVEDLTAALARTLAAVLIDAEDALDRITAAA